MRDTLLKHIRDTYLDKKVFDSSYSRIAEQLTPELEDIFLLTFVDSFYAQELNKNFISYFQSVTPEQLEETAPQLWNTHKRLLSEIAKGIHSISEFSTEHNKVALIGDLHPYKNMRYLVNGKILFDKTPYYDSLIKKLLIYFPNLTNCFPSHSEIGGFYSREYIPVNLNANSEEEIKQYYNLFGQLLGFVLTIRGIDLNAENIIINMPYPVLFDLECIFSGYQDISADYTLDSTGMALIDPVFDVSAFSGGTKPVKSYLKPVLTGTETVPEIKWSVPSKGKYYNIPELNGTAVNPMDYINEVIAGLRASHTIVKKNYSKIAKIVEDTEIGTRTIISPTRLYRIALQSYAFPQIYTRFQSSDYFRTELSKRQPIFSIQAEGLLMEHEIECLNSWLVPKYISEIHSPEIRNSGGDIVAKYKTTQYGRWLGHYKHIDQVFENAENRFKEVYATK